MAAAGGAGAAVDEHIPLNTLSGYDLLEIHPGKIPKEVTKIETLADAVHDFLGSRSKPRIKQELKRYINAGLGEYKTNEHDTSDKIHVHFNGTNPANILKADLRLTSPYEVYSNTLADRHRLLSNLFIFPDDLAIQVITGENLQRLNVKPLAFMLQSDDASIIAYRPILTMLQNVLTFKYGLLPTTGGLLGLTHDGYKRSDQRGNPFAQNIIITPGTLCDSATTGSSEGDIRTSQENGTFNTISPISGESFWGGWTLTTNSVVGNYNGATLLVTIDDNVITIEVPKGATNFPSVLDLSVIYERIVERDSRVLEKKSVLAKLIAELRLKNIKMRTTPDFVILYTNIILKCMELPDGILLKFLLFLKEFGDMVQHMFAIGLKHLAGGSTDGLSSIAFLKRGTPVSYTLAKDKAGIARIKFRVAGTAHIQGAISAEDWAIQVERLKTQQAADLAAINTRKAAIKARKDALARARALEERIVIDAEKARSISALESRAARAARGRTSIRDARSTADFDDIFAAEILASIRERLATPNASINSLRKSLRKRKQSGGYLRKTFKQRGGTGLSVDAIVDIINTRLTRLIYGLYNNLYNVLSSPGRSTSLFNVLALDDTNDFIDMTLVGTKGRSRIFLDNTLLGLPLGKIIYVLYNNLYDLTENTYTEVQINTEIDSLIDDFLIGCNFKAEDITYIKAHTIPIVFPELVAAATGIEGTGVTRELTEDDIDELQKRLYGIELFENEFSTIYPTLDYNMGPSTQAYDSHNGEGLPMRRLTETQRLLQSKTPSPTRIDPGIRKRRREIQKRYELLFSNPRIRPGKKALEVIRNPAPKAARLTKNVLTLVERNPFMKRLTFARNTPRKSRKNSTLRKRRI